LLRRGSFGGNIVLPTRQAMPKGPQGQKRPADTVANAIRVAKILTGEIGLKLIFA
jgi:hypothetical protein